MSADVFADLKIKEKTGILLIGGWYYGSCFIDENLSAMKIISVVLVIFIFVLLTVPAAYFKQYWLAMAFFIFGVIFLVTEIAAMVCTGSSVSQHFWNFSALHKKEALIIISGMFLSWVALLTHLSAKLFSK